MLKSLWRASALAAGLLACVAAQAHLGGPESSVQADTVKWQAPVSVVRNARFVTYTQTSGEGVAVRQYVSPAGVVFAVAWEGPVLPDLDGLLAAYAPVYRDALQQRRRSVRIDTPRLYLESGGMMRAYVGRALVPALMPAGVTVADIP